MKRILTLLLTLILTVGLAACAAELEIGIHERTDTQTAEENSVSDTNEQDRMTVEEAAEDEDIFDYARLYEAGEIGFTFNDYGWFQFSLVNHVLGEMRDFESVLADTGFESEGTLPTQRLTFSSIGEEDIPEILAAVFAVLHEQGIEMPWPMYHTLNDDPNMHMVPGFGITLEMLEEAGLSMAHPVNRVWPPESR